MIYRHLYTFMFSFSSSLSLSKQIHSDAGNSLHEYFYSFKYQSNLIIYIALIHIVQKRSATNCLNNKVSRALRNENR